MATKELGKTGMTVTADLGDGSSDLQKMTSWSKVELALPNFDWASKFAKYIEQAEKLMKAFVVILEGILALLSALIEDAYIKIIKQVIEEIKRMLEGLLDDLGLYLLFVPIRKRVMTNFMGLGDITPANKALSALFQNNTTALQNQAGNPIKQEFITNINRYMGGNYGFFTTVVESLYDQGDIHRPQFNNPDDYVGGMVWVMGTALDPFGLLDDLWRLLGMFGDLFRMSAPSLAPVPTGLTARAIAYPTDATPKASFLLEWDIPKFPRATIPDLGNVIYTPIRYAVIAVKNAVEAAGAQNVVQLMGTRDLKQGLTAFNGKVVVLKEDKWDFTKVAYVAKGLEAKRDDGFFFYIAWKCEITRGMYKLGTLDYWDLSNCAYVVPYPTPPRSTPPDWVRTPSIAEIFPELGYFLRLMMAELEKLADKLIAPGDLLKQYLDFLNEEVGRYAALVDAILEQIKRITELLNLPKIVGGIYCRSFFGKGGNQFFLSDLANSLMPSFPNAPPFTRGDEYVTGVVWLAGGPRPTVQISVDALKALFPTKSDTENMVGSLGDEISTLEAQYFGDNLQVSTPPPTFDEALCPLFHGSAIDPSSEIPEIVFNDRFEPISAR